MSKTKPINKTLEGVLINTHVKEPPQEINFDDVSNDLLMTNANGENANMQYPDKNPFDIKKAVIPLVIGTGALFAGAGGISYALKRGTKAITNSKSFEQLPDLALNMNIKQEPFEKEQLMK